VGDKSVIKLLIAIVFSGAVLVPGGRSVPERDLLRGFAFSQCLAKAYQGTTFAADAQRAAEFYREVGATTRPEVYDTLSRIAQAGDPGKPAAVDGRNLGIVSCLEVYEGRAVRAAVTRAK
jgi:hypothetical protein